MKLSALLCGLVLAAIPCSSALADPVQFDFSFTGTLFSGSGVFDATSLGNGEYQITGISGTVGGTSIYGILPTGTYPTGFLQVANDNLLIYPGTWGLNSPSYFDDAGVSFQVGTGRNAYDVNLNDTWFVENAVAGSWNVTEADCITVTPAAPSVPEPSSLILLGSGMLAAAGAVRRRLTV